MPRSVASERAAIISARRRSEVPGWFCCIVLLIEATCPRLTVRGHVFSPIHKYGACPLACAKLSQQTNDCETTHQMAKATAGQFSPCAHARGLNAVYGPACDNSMLCFPLLLSSGHCHQQGHLVFVMEYC